jgi:peptidoglycan/LPS O-acetylase OafA/YrhL
MFRIVPLYISLLAVTAALVLSLNALDAGTGVSLTAFGLFGVSIGLAIAFFIDRIPEISRPRRTRRRPVPPRT